jgi:YD repeat-containing protein
MTAYAEGQPTGSGCVAPPMGSAVNLSYDLVGRLETTDFPDSTPDIDRSYDANGNLLTINRGGVNWTYTYNALDLVESESLTVDARTYLIDSVYDTSGTLISKRFPSGRTYSYANDGHGRPIGVSLRQHALPQQRHLSSQWENRFDGAWQRWPL